MAIRKINSRAIADGAVATADLDDNPLTIDSLTVDTNTLVVDATNNRVGVGTASPSRQLHISDASESNIRLQGGADYAEIRVKDADNALSFHYGGSEAMRLLAGGGLTFNGDTAAANALDDYEEGTWTPTLRYSGGSVTYGSQYGNYTKIGNVVYISAMVNATNTSSVILYDLNDLPFTVGGYSGWYPGPAVSNAYYVGLGSGGTTLGGYWVNGGIYLRFHTNGNNTNQLSPTVTGGQWHEVRIQGFYTV